MSASIAPPPDSHSSRIARTCAALCTSSSSRALAAGARRRSQPSHSRQASARSIAYSRSGVSGCSGMCARGSCRRQAGWSKYSPPVISRRHGVVIPAASQQRCGRGDQAGEDREGERLVQAAAKRRGDQVGKERAPGERRPVGSRERGEHMGAQQVLDRVVAEERGEQARDRRQVAPTGRRRAAARRGPSGRGRACAGRLAARPRIISVKKIADREHLGASSGRSSSCPPPAPRCSGGRLFITAARLGEANRPMPDAVQQQDQRERRVGEVDRQQSRAAGS